MKRAKKGHAVKQMKRVADEKQGAERMEALRLEVRAALPPPSSPRMRYL